MTLSKTQKAKRNGIADCLLYQVCKVNSQASRSEKQAYISGYLEGQALLHNDPSAQDRAPHEGDYQSISHWGMFPATSRTGEEATA